MKSSEIASVFVDFFKSQGFDLLPQSSLLDPSIPMSFVMSAGLVQIERSLNKLKTRKNDKYVLVQNCFRHFDIEKVGMDDIHLSFFNMLGAFVFGNLHPEDTVQSMWTLATTVLNLDPNRLWATYFEGDEFLGKSLPKDICSFSGWKNVGLPDRRIVGLGIKDNFWIQKNGFQNNGQPKKSGPNTELFWDKGESYSCGSGCKPGCGCGRFVEFCNSLFVQFETTENGLRKIEIPFTETVIGVERVEMLQHNLNSVFETSIYTPVINTLKNLITDNVESDDILAGLGIIADHTRALFQLVADGAPPPGKDGRARIVKLLIRGIITQQIVLGIETKDFFPLVLKNTFTDRFVQNDVYLKTIFYFHIENIKYRKTLNRGKKQFMQLIKQNCEEVLSDNQIRELRTRWGIPYAIAKKMSETILTNIEKKDVTNFA